MYLQNGQLYTVSNDPPPRPRKPAATAEIGRIGAKLYDMASSLWAQLTAGLLSLGGFVLISQRRKQRREESRTGSDESTGGNNDNL